MDVSHRQELSTSSSYFCCCEPEFDLTLIVLLIREPTRRSRFVEHALHPGAVAARLESNNVRELRAHRRHVLGDGGLGSILTASPFSYSSAIEAPAEDYSGSSTNCFCINTWYDSGPDFLSLIHI